MENAGRNVNRRQFVGMGMGMGALAAATGALGINQAQAAFEEAAPLTEPAAESDLDRYRMNTSLETINALRQKVIDSFTEDYVCADGTVVANVYVKMRALLDGLGAGIGLENYTGDDSFEFFQRLCNNDEKIAEIYVKSPLGRRFTALDAAVATGYTEAECEEALDALTFNGAMFRVTVGGLKQYNHQRSYHGICESSGNLYMDDGYIASFNAAITGMNLLPFPCYYPIPMNKDICTDSKVLAYDDLDGLLARHEIFAVTPCQCRYLAPMVQPTEEMPDFTDLETCKDFICADGHHLEKCVTFGEEAQFYIEQGLGRQLTRDECREILRRQAEDEGCVLQSCYTKYTEVICCCDGGCTNMPGYYNQGTDAPVYPNQSHYNLEYDADLCIKCGACESRCPLNAIEMTGEDGAPEVTGYCFRCGQCCYICPVEARKLTLKDESLIPELPEDLMDWINKDTMYRYEKGMWPAEGIVAE